MKAKSALFVFVLMCQSLLLQASLASVVLAFEKSPDGKTIPNWSAARGGAEVEDVQSEGLSVIESDSPGHPTVLRIESQGNAEKFLLTQTREVPKLLPDTEYELRAVARVTAAWQGRKAGVSFLVTDAGWQWQSPRLVFAEERTNWETYTLRFRTPPEMKNTNGRIRIELVGIGEAEIAGISLSETAEANAEKSQTGASSGAGAARRILTLDEMDKTNLVPNGDFSQVTGSTLRAWAEYPAGTSLITIARPPAATGLKAVEMNPGAGSLTLRSESIPVEPGKPYSLAVDLQQEEIPIGFAMGGQLQLRWAADMTGASQPQVLELVDGDFDWRTLSYSIEAPPDARFVQILLTKRGSPGNVAFRNVRFAEGILQRVEKDLSDKELFAIGEAFSFLGSRADYFLANKNGLGIPGIPELRKEISAGIERQRAIIQDVLRARNAELTDEQKFEVKWAEMLKGNLGLRVRPDFPYFAEWKELEGKVGALKIATEEWLKANNRERMKNEMVAVFGEFPGYVVGIDSPMTKVLRDRPYLGKPMKTAEIALARNEEESVQITLAPLDADLAEVVVQIGPLETAEGGKFPPDLLSVSRIDFVKTNAPQYDVDEVGWWPDIVFPENTAKLIPQGTNQSFWVTASTNAETPPGDYAGNILVKSGGKTLQTIPLRVRVWDITLPKPGKFKVVGRFSPGQLSEFYKWDTPKEDVLAEWNRYIFAKRWNSTDPFLGSLSPKGKSLQAAVKEGLNSVILLNVSQLLEKNQESRTYTWPDTAREKLIQERVKAAVDEFKATAGNSEALLYLFGFDEQHERGQYPLMKHVFDLAKAAAPGTRTITTTTYSPLKDLAGSVDAWVPLLGHDTDDLRRRQQAGNELFFYVYAHPFHPYPNPSQIDYPGIDGRITFWLAAAQGYTGFLHWLMNGWWSNTQKEERWPAIEWNPYAKDNFARRNGEGYFLYPGPDEKPVSSVRFELIRDGIEDWELINLLKEAIAKKEQSDPASPGLAQARAALYEGKAIVPAMDSYSQDPQRLMSVRAKIADAVVALGHNPEAN